MKKLSTIKNGGNFFMIGMIFLAIIALMIFFGVTGGFFEKMGVANWVAFLIVLAFAVAAVFPPLILPINVSFSFAGFIMPLLIGIVMLFAIGANGMLLRAVVASLAIAGIVIATRIALPPLGSYAAAIPSILIVGIVSGMAAFLIGQGRMAMLASVLCGIVLGDFITALLFRFVSGASGNLLSLGQNGIFDSLVLSVFVGGVAIELYSLVQRRMARRAGETEPLYIHATAIEAAEDTPLEKSLSEAEEDDLFDDYFNDDID